LPRQFSEQQVCGNPHGAPGIPQLIAAQRPPWHWPEQHSGPDVQMALVDRQVPVIRQLPITQLSPVQQSAG
jgi:hypothetical protein